MLDTVTSLSAADNAAQLAPLIVTPLPVPAVIPARIMPWMSHELRTPNQPPWLRVYRTAGPAFRVAMHRSSVLVSLFNFETNCAHYGLPPIQGESDEARYHRWLTGMDRAVTEAPIDGGNVAGASAQLGIHHDGPHDVVGMARINSATVIPDPLQAVVHYFDLAPLVAKIESGTVPLRCFPLVYGGFFKSHLPHAGAALATPGGRPLLGPHLPQPGQLALGRNLTWRRTNAGLFVDDFD